MSDISRLHLYGDDELEQVLEQVSSVLTVAGAPPGLIHLYNAISLEQQTRKNVHVVADDGDDTFNDDWRDVDLRDNDDLYDALFWYEE